MKTKLEELQSQRLQMFEQMLKDLEKIDKSKNTQKIKYEQKYKIATKYYYETKKIDIKIKNEERKLSTK